MEIRLNKVIYVLSYLYENKNRKIFKSQIANDLQITYVHIHKLIHKLEKKNLIYLERDGERKKPIYIKLTDRGEYIGMMCSKLIDTGIEDG